jgi:hypothetical protein
MDCKTARLLFLHFQRPRAGELDDDEATALNNHLAGCLDCAGLARTEQAVDAHLGRAMRAVEVPDGLRTRLVEHLAAERDAYWSRQTGRCFRIGVPIAAVLLVAVGFLIWWFGHVRPGIDLADVFHKKNLTTFDQDAVRDAFARLGVKTEPPSFLNYTFLTSYGLSELPGHEGKKVPQLVFSNGKRRAVVYIVSEQQFKLESLDAPHAVPDDGYTYKLDVRPDREGARRHAYLIFYTGGGYGWLRAGEDRAG